VEEDDMNKFLASFLILGFLLTFDSPTYAHDRSKKSGVVMPGINVSVYNYAQVPEQTLERTEKEVARVFREVGVEATWRNCNLSPADTHQDANCTQLATPTNLILRILPEIPVTQGVANDHTMGFAFGNFATVSFRWAQEEAAAVGAMPSEILTVAATHELGHLLLGAESHAPRGVMRARFSREDFARAPLGAFTFTTEQGQQMRAEAGRRVLIPGAAEVTTAAVTK
jgi:hypothetical protein